MEQKKIDELLEFLERKYPNRSSAELFDLLEVVIGCNEIVESAGSDREIVEAELLKRYGDGELPDGNETGEGRCREFDATIREIVRRTVEMINNESPLVESTVAKKRKYVLGRVVEELQKLM
jgi:hypothetical protein